MPTRHRAASWLSLAAVLILLISAYLLRDPSKPLPSGERELSEATGLTEPLGHSEPNALEPSSDEDQPIPSDAIVSTGRIELTAYSGSTPLSGVPVKAVPAPARAFYPGATVYSGTTGQHGQLQIEVEPGTYRLHYVGGNAVKRWDPDEIRHKRLENGLVADRLGLYPKNVSGLLTVAAGITTRASLFLFGKSGVKGTLHFANIPPGFERVVFAFYETYRMVELDGETLIFGGSYCERRVQLAPGLNRFEMSGLPTGPGALRATCIDVCETSNVRISQFAYRWFYLPNEMLDLGELRPEPGRIDLRMAVRVNGKEVDWSTAFSTRPVVNVHIKSENPLGFTEMKSEFSPVEAQALEDDLEQDPRLHAYYQESYIWPFNDDIRVTVGEQVQLVGVPNGVTVRWGDLHSHVREYLRPSFTYRGLQHSAQTADAETTLWIDLEETPVEVKTDDTNVSFSPHYPVGRDPFPLVYYVFGGGLAKPLTVESTTYLAPGSYQVFALSADLAEEAIAEANFTVAEEGMVDVSLVITSSTRVVVTTSAELIFGLRLVPVDWPFSRVNGLLLRPIENGSATFYGVPPGIEFVVEPASPEQQDLVDGVIYRAGAPGEERELVLPW